MASLGGSYTLQQFIDSSNKTVISYDKFSTLQTLDNIKFPVYHVLDDYLPELKKLCLTVTMSDAEYHRYKYRPKLLAYDIYGSTELDFVILAVNGLADMKDFDMKTIKAIKKAYLTQVLSQIYNSEYSFINENRK
jgi:hypothetical protein